MSDNIIFKDGVYGFRCCIIAYHGDSIIDYIFESTINNNIKLIYTTGHKTFNTIEEAKSHIIEKFNSIPT